MRTVAALGLCLALGACLSPLGLLTGGGPNVAANGQAGATNAQTLGVTDQSAQTVTRSTVGTVRQSRDQNAVTAEKVGQVIVNQSAWKREAALWLLVIIALFLDSPRRWPGEIMAAFRRRKKT